MPKRTAQVLLILIFLCLCWLGMQIVHEAGHVIGAVATGGQVEKVLLHPLAFSRTDVNPNPHPVIEVWAGPLAGVLLPLVMWAVARKAKPATESFFRFFAGFCCLANGVYIGFGGSGDGTDTGTMLKLGAHRWQMLLFALPAMGLGLWLWNGTGSAFGLGRADGKVSRTALAVSLMLLAIVVAAELFLSKP